MALREFDKVEVGEELPPRSVALTRSDLVQYAGVAGDPNPIHWSESVVKQVGLEDVVAHGMLTMGVGAGFITSWLGDPGALLEYNVRFTSPVYVPDDDTGGVIELSGKVKSIDAEEKSAVIALVARSAGKKIWGRATATVRLA